LGTETAAGQRGRRRLTGLFVPEGWPIGSYTLRHQTVDSILNGASNTIMLSENVRAGYDPAKGTSWATLKPENNTFVLSSYVCEGRNCAAGKVDYRRANDSTQDPAQVKLSAGDY
jgi:hypothetical protein